MDERLTRERERLSVAWRRFVTADAPPSVQSDVRDSWARSRRHVPPERVSAPVEDPERTREEWQDSLLEHASRELRPELQGLADEGDLIVAVSDPGGRLLWTHGSERMSRLARGINFVAGGRWDEGSVGTNALALALRTGRAVRVFSAEHYVQAVHDWVCYSAPVRSADTGEVLGVLDFSTTWERASPLGLGSVLHYAHLIEKGVAPAPAAGLRVQVCGGPRVTLDGTPLHLSPRQLEVLCVLALSPGGLTLDELHAHLYGDRPVSPSTLKAEVSALRLALGGAVASRPYRLTLDADLDARWVEDALLRGAVLEALAAYGGPLLPHSDSPLLTYWREYLDAALREAALRDPDSEALWRYTIRFGDDPEVLHALRSRLGPSDPRLPAVIARLRAAEGV